MAKLTKLTAFKAHVPKPETAMDKTTRIVKKIADEEAEKRLVKMNRLRSARLERSANTRVDDKPAGRKTRLSKAATKS